MLSASVFMYCSIVEFHRGSSLQTCTSPEPNASGMPTVKQAVIKTCSVSDRGCINKHSSHYVANITNHTSTMTTTGTGLVKKLMLFYMLKCQFWTNTAMYIIIITNYTNFWVSQINEIWQTGNIHCWMHQQKHCTDVQTQKCSTFLIAT